MQATTELLKRWFVELNRRFFSGELPLPRFTVGNSRTMLGSLRWKVRRIGLKERQTDYVIRISNYYDVSEDEFRNVLLHEMIHYYIAVKGIKDTAPHGVAFRRIMNRVNACGWHVTVRERRRMPVAEHNERNNNLCFVLAITTNDGKKMLTTVSRAAIPRLNRQLSNVSSVACWEWRISTDSAFNSWSRVRTLRFPSISSAEYDRLIGLTQALPM